MTTKTIGILTGGGDAPGMNACIASIANSAAKRGIQLRGIFGGFRGLIEANSIPLSTEISGLARRGGTFLGTSRNNGLEEKIRQIGIKRAMESCHADSLIILGGGGSLEAAASLSKEGVPVVGIPCTIDNDVYGTEYCLGFDTAINKGLRAADEITDTAESLAERVFVLETLGGTTGHIAIATAYATGADAVFIHEVTPDVESAAERIKAKMDAGGTHGLVVLCEGLGTNEIAQKLEAITGRRVRITVLGHTQRGGSPTYLDRAVGREFGERALEMMISGDTDKTVIYTSGKTSAIPLSEVVNKRRELDMWKYRAVNKC